MRHSLTLGLALVVDTFDVDDVDVDVEIRQVQAKPLILLIAYTLLIYVTKLPITLTSAPGSLQ